ncbi:hypothetical protein BDV3_003078 [Batrachochytrium dendrobatidis]
MTSNSNIPPVIAVRRSSRLFKTATELVGLVEASLESDTLIITEHPVKPRPASKYLLRRTITTDINCPSVPSGPSIATTALDVQLSDDTDCKLTLPLADEFDTLRKPKRCPHLKKMVMVPKILKVAQSMYIKDSGCHSCKSKLKAGSANPTTDVLVPRQRGLSAPIMASRDTAIGQLASASISAVNVQSQLASNDNDPSIALSCAVSMSSPLVGFSARQLWICLCCAKLSCGSETQDHVRAHAIKRQHHLVMNTDSYDCWCFACSCDIIGQPNANKVILEARRILEKHRRPPRLLPLESIASPFSSTGEATHASTAKKLRSTALKIPGLNNIGNTCFFNSVMQSLTYTQHLYKYIPESESFQTNSSTGSPIVNMELSLSQNTSLHNTHQSASQSSDHVNSDLPNQNDPVHIASNASVCKLDLPLVEPNDPAAQTSIVSNTSLPKLVISHKTTLTNELFRFFRTMRKQLLAESSSSVNPRNLFAEISRQWDSYSSYQQQDSHELLRRLLDGIKEEQYAKDNNERVISFQQKTFIDDVFGGRMASIIVCDTCKHPSFSFESFLDVSLSIIKPMERRASMRNFLSTVIKPRSRLPSPISSKRELLPQPVLKTSDAVSSNGSDDESIDKAAEKTLTDNANRSIITKGLELLRLSPRRGPINNPVYTTIPSPTPLSSPNTLSAQPFFEELASFDLATNQLSKSPPSSSTISPSSKLQQVDPISLPPTEAQCIATMQSLLKSLDPSDLGLQFERAKTKSFGSTSSNANIAASLSRCLTDFMSVETLEGENGLHCDNCYKLKYGNEEDQPSSCSSEAVRPTSIEVSAATKNNELPSLFWTASTPGRIQHSSFSQLLPQSQDTPLVQDFPAAALLPVAKQSTNQSSKYDEDSDDCLALMADSPKLPDHPIESVQSETELQDDMEDHEDESTSSSSDLDFEIHNVSLTIPVEEFKPSVTKPTTQTKKHPPCISRAYKRFLLYDAPQTLVLHLKRFEQIGNTERTRKLDLMVPFEEWLNLDSVMTPPEVCETLPKQKGTSQKNREGDSNGSQFEQVADVSSHHGDGHVTLSVHPSSATQSMLNPSPVLTLAHQDALSPVPTRRQGGWYRLYAVVVHSGSIFGGHYVSYVRVPPLERIVAFGADTCQVDRCSTHDTWAFCSDSAVRYATLDEVLKCQAYILFYERTSL